MLSRRLVLPTVLLALLLGGPVLVPRSDAGSRPGHELAGPDGRFARISGVDVHHEVTGPADAPAAVLLHHFYGNTATWRHVGRTAGITPHGRLRPPRIRSHRAASAVSLGR
jgi:hypothetical protein